MGCSSCSSGGSKPRGCGSKGSCSSGGCNKLEVFDWLSNMQLPTNQKLYDIVEVRFKNGRKDFYKNSKSLSLQVGDAVVVEAESGVDVGVVSIKGELVKIQIKKKISNFKTYITREIYRIATSEDLEKWKEAKDLEYETMNQARVLAIKNNLQMKIFDVEYQADKSKAVFYYTANKRIDFRNLIKDMASQFKIRIEMKQIGSRQEASRIGGIGSCGRELCCSTWLTDFRSVSTSSLRYQQLAFKPEKFAGQCGNLKCCLNFELDAYLDAIKDFPNTNIKLKTVDGYGVHIKTDVFKRILWYSFRSKSNAQHIIVPLSPEQTFEIIKLNQNNQYPNDLKEFSIDLQSNINEEPNYTNVVGQDNLNRFEYVFKRKKKSRKTKSKSKIKANSTNQKKVNKNSVQSKDKSFYPRNKKSS